MDAMLAQVAHRELGESLREMIPPKSPHSTPHSTPHRATQHQVSRNEPEAGSGGGGQEDGEDGEDGEDRQEDGEDGEEDGKDPNHHQRVALRRQIKFGKELDLARHEAEAEVRQRARLAWGQIRREVVTHPAAGALTTFPMSFARFPCENAINSEFSAVN